MINQYTTYGECNENCRDLCNTAIKTNSGAYYSVGDLFNCYCCKQITK